MPLTTQLSPLADPLIQTIISGVLVTVVAAALLGIWSLIRKGVKNYMAVKTQLNDILEAVNATKDEQLAQRKDLKMLFRLMDAVLAGSQLTAKSLRQVQFEDEAPFNGDLKAASAKINNAVKELNDYLDDKAFPDCEE